MQIMRGIERQFERRLIYFYGCNLPVELLVGLQIEFYAQNFPLIRTIHVCM
jgi:hypothetical protein